VNDEPGGGDAMARSRWQIAGALGLTAVVVVLVLWTTIDLGFGFDFDVPSAVATIRDWGRWGVLGSIGLMVLHSFIPFPAEILACANGMVYGPFLGALITWTGAMLGAVTAFGLTRRIGAPFVQRMLTPAQAERLVQWADEQGTGAMLVSRLLPVIAFNLINYAAALAGIPWRTFLWTTGLGIVPMTVLTAVLGDRVLAVPMWIWAAASAVLLPVAIFTYWMRRHPRGRTGDFERK